MTTITTLNTTESGSQKKVKIFSPAIDKFATNVGQIISWLKRENTDLKRKCQDFDGSQFEFKKKWNENKLLNAVIENNISVIVAYDENWKLLLWNKKMIEISWYDPEDEIEEFWWEKLKNLTSDQIMKLLYKWEEYDRVVSYLTELKLTWRWYSNIAFTMTRKDWTKRIVLWNTTPFKWWTVRSWQDITELHYAKWMLLKDSAFDCYNRLWLLDWLTHLVLQKKWVREWDDVINNVDHHAIAFWDLDDFKIINDIFWYGAWDLILKEFISFLKNKLRDLDIISRYWWDEFYLILKWSTKSWAIKKINDIREEFGKLTFKIENFKIVEIIKHSSRDEAIEYIEKNNVIIKDGWLDLLDWTSFLWGIWSSWWVTDLIYDNQNQKFYEYEKLSNSQMIDSDDTSWLQYSDKLKQSKKIEAKTMLDYKKTEAHKILEWVKYLKYLEWYNLWKNWVWSFIKDENFEIIWVQISYDNGIEVQISLNDLALISKIKEENKENIKR